MYRKRRQPTPSFKLPSPYDPISGKRANLFPPGNFPYCALMQVAAEDTHDNYVVCRGWDPRDGRFYDYVAGDEDQVGISVAKPYGNRYTGQYEIGQVFAALLPLGAEVVPVASPFGPLGQNPGVAATSTGHPADLDETVEILYDDQDRPINWILVDSGGGDKARWLECFADGAFTTSDEYIDVTTVTYHDGQAPDTDVTQVRNPTASSNYLFSGDSGTKGIALYAREDDEYVAIQWEC